MANSTGFSGDASWWEVAFDAAGDGLVITDPTLPDNPIVYANEAFLRMTGYCADEVLGRNCRFLQGADREQKGRHAMRAGVEAAETCRVVVRNYRKDGTRFWNEVAISPAFDAAGRLVRFFGIQRDVTARVQAEAALEASEQRLRMIVENSPDLVYQLNLQTLAYDYLGPAWAEKMGPEAEALRRRGAPALHARVHPDDRAAAARHLARFQEGKVREGQVLQAEYRLQAGQPGYRWFRDTAQLVRDPGGRPLAMVGFVRDIAEQKYSEVFQAEQILVLRQVLRGEGLREALEEITGLADTLAPDLRVLMLVREPRSGAWHIGASRGLPEAYLQFIDANLDPGRADSASTLGSSEAFLSGLMKRAAWETHRSLLEAQRLRLVHHAPVLLSNRESGGGVLVYLAEDTERPDELFRITEMMAGLASVGLADHYGRRRLESRLMLRAAVSEVSTRLFQQTEPDLPALLALVGQAADVDRGYVMMLRDRGFGLSAAWAAPGVPPLDAGALRLETSRLRGWMERLAADETIIIRPAEEGGGEPYEPVQALHGAPFRSLLAVPISAGRNELLGFLGVETVREPRRWDEDETRTLAIAGRLVAAALLRNRAQQAVEERSAMHQALLNALPDAFFRLGRDGRVLGVKPASTVPFSQQVVVGHAFTDALPEPSASIAMAYVDRVLQHGRHEVWQFSHTRAAGREDFEMRFVPSGQDEVTAIVREVTAERRLEAEILEVSAREQQRIGQDLHDGLGQELAGLSYMCHSLVQQLAGHAPPLRALATQLQQGLGRVLEHTHALSRGLNPIEVVSDGLAHALGELADRLADMYQLPCRFEHDPAATVPDATMAYHLFRIAQEAASNAMRHARARAVVVRLARTAEALRLEVSDDGAGFDAAQTPHRGMGLHTMQYRARLVGATLQICSTPGTGTDIVCIVPDLGVRKG